MASDPAIYTQLVESKAEIRVLDLQPGEYEDEISCTLRTVSLHGKPTFEALSYVWGDAKVTRPIQVNGRRFEATINLADFLRALRKTDEVFTIWADAICINQADVSERTSQVKQMGDIYRQSSRTRVWLGEFEHWKEDISEFWAENLLSDGPDEETSTTARILATIGITAENAASKITCDMQFDGTLVDVLRICLAVASNKHAYEMPFFKIIPGDQARGIAGGIRRDGAWEYAMGMLAWIVTRPWWTRVWTLQEATLSREDPILHAGLAQFSLQPILEVGSWAFRHTSCCNLSKVAWACTLGMHCLFPQIFRLSIAKSALLKTKSDSYENILEAALSRHAADPRDYLFGIAGALTEHTLPIIVDYTFPLEIVCCQATSILVHSDASDRRLWPSMAVGVSSVSLPTWVIHLTKQKENPEIGHIGAGAKPSGVYFDTKALVPDWRSPVLRLKATKATWMLDTSPPMRPEEDGVLGVQTVFERWSETVKDNGIAFSPHNFWRAILLEQPTVDQLTNSGNRDVLKASHSYDFSYSKLNPKIIEDMIEWQSTVLDIKEPIAANAEEFTATQILDRRYTVLEIHCKARSFIVAETGDYGISVPEVQPGDEIYICQSAGALLALRRQEPQPGIEEPTFKLVGPCHLNGWMDGKRVDESTVWEDIAII